MSHRRARLGLVAAVAAAGVVLPAAGAVAAPGTVTPSGPTVTLLTGDEVTLGGVHGVDVHAAPGREHISFLTRKDEQGDTHVIPEDAVRLLSQGKLDPRLFDVSELARNGYDDASRNTLPLIVDYKGRTPRVAGAQVSRELPAMSAAAVSAERSGDFWVTAQNAEHVWLDGPVRMSLDRSVAQIGAPEAWAAGHTGAGTTVAVLDTGIDVTHPDLSDAVVGAHNFTDSDTDDDRVGHGTHVASTVTGKGAKYQGVAPDAKLLNGKVLNDGGGGYESWIIAGMEWAADSGADVVNMSLGSQFPSDGTDPISQAVNRLTADTGTLFVVAAGNSGGLVTSPAAADAALTVGAVDRNDQLAGFSSRGRLDGGLKPDITAPGVDIVAAKAKNGYLGTPVEDGYVSLSGTSMATPHVAGAAAILAGEHPDWTADQLKATLMGSARPTDGLTVFEQGAGRVDVAKATTATVSASPGSVNFGVAQWPHDDDQPVGKTLTYINTGTAPVTLELTVSGAPQGMFTITPAQVTVPAGGQAGVTVTADTSVDVADGVYGGVVTATGDGRTVRTPVGVNREAETYEVTMRFIDHNGAPTDFYGAELINVHKREIFEPYDWSGTAKIRLPRGEYYFDAVIVRQNDAGNRHIAVFVEPSIMLDRDVELVLDAREAKPVSVQVDRPNARPGSTTALFERETSWGTLGLGAFLHDDLGSVKPANTSSDKFTMTVDSHLAEWNGTSFHGSPYIYHVRHTEHGTVPQTLRWRYRDRQFAKVRSEHATSGSGLTGWRDDFVTFPLPGTLTEYYTPDVPWDGGTFGEMTAPDVYPVLTSVYQTAPRTFQLGRTTTVRWGYGVTGPALPASTSGGWEYAGRDGDRLSFNLPLAADQDRDRQGYAWTGTSTLLRDGEVVGDYPYAGAGSYEVGPDRAVYTLRTTANRPAAMRVSTRIDAEWTFASAHTAELTGLPLLAVRFAPDLDAHNAARAGKRFTIPVYVQRSGGALGNVDRPVVEVSYDDGATWRPATVKPNHGEWKAVVDHPAGAAFVSLRSSVADPDGNTQRQTIIRAYALK